MEGWSSPLTVGWLVELTDLLTIQRSDKKTDLPKAQMSDLLLNFVYRMTSGDAHLIGNFVPSDAVYSSSMTYL